MGEKRDIFSIKRSTLKGTHQTQAPQPWWRPTKPCRPLGSYWNWFCHSHPVTPNILARAGLWNWMTEIRQEEIGSLECQPQPGIADTQLGGGGTGAGTYLGLLVLVCLTEDRKAKTNIQKKICVIQDQKGQCHHLEGLSDSLPFFWSFSSKPGNLQSERSQKNGIRWFWSF